MNAPQAFEIKEDIAHYIGGQVVLPQGTRFADVHNPAKGSVARRVALASKADKARPSCQRASVIRPIPTSQNADEHG